MVALEELMEVDPGDCGWYESDCVRPRALRGFLEQQPSNQLPGLNFSLNFRLEDD